MPLRRMPVGKTRFVTNYPGSPRKNYYCALTDEKNSQLLLNVYP